MAIKGASWALLTPNQLTTNQINYSLYDLWSFRSLCARVRASCTTKTDSGPRESPTQKYPFMPSGVGFSPLFCSLFRNAPQSAPKHLIWKPGHFGVVLFHLFFCMKERQFYTQPEASTRHNHSGDTDVDWQAGTAPTRLQNSHSRRTAELDALNGPPPLLLLFQLLILAEAVFCVPTIAHRGARRK